MGRPRIVLIASLVLIAIGSLAFGSEVGNIHFGSLYVHPQIGLDATYDDNIFLLGPSKEDDVLVKVKPGLGLDYTKEGKSASLTYLAEIGRYVDFSDYDYENHYLNAAVDLQFPSGLSFFAGDIFRKTNDRLTYEFQPLIKRIDNTFDTKLGYEFTDRLSCRVGYDNRMIDYDAAKYSVYDRTEDFANGTVFYRIFNRVSLLAQFQYRWIDYDQEVVRFDGEGYEAFLGVTGQLTPKMVAVLKAGWQERKYDGPGEDWDGGVFGVDIVHRVTETLMLTVGGSRDAIESAYANNNYYTQTEARVGLEKDLGTKFVLGVTGFYANNDYPEATVSGGSLSQRDDDIWGASLRVRYLIQRWLSTYLSYTYEQRDSNQDEYDYEDNRVSLGVSAVF